jgi:hypothetical protein
MTRFCPRTMSLLSVMFVVLAMAGCGRSHQISGDLVGIGPGLYKDPISTGIPVASARKAAKLVSFPIVTPQGLGPVQRVLISDPHQLPRTSRAVAFLFETRQYGRVDVVEEPMQVSRAEYDRENRGLLAQNGSPLTHGSVALPTVRGGKQALITTSEDGRTSYIFWMEHRGMEISIIGPSLNRSDCVQIANGV